MAFQAPRIIGGGKIITPQAQGNPFAGVTDAINTGRERTDKLSKEELERKMQVDRDRAAAAATYLGEYDVLGEDNKPLSIQQYTEELYPEQSYQSQVQPSLLDLTKNKFGYGEGQWAPGKLIGQGIGKGYRSVADYFANKKNANRDRQIEEGKTKFHEDNDKYFDQDNSNNQPTPQKEMSSNDRIESIKANLSGDKDRIKALQKRIGASVDGDWGPETERLLLESMNKGKQQGGYTHGDEPSGYSLEGGGDVPGNDTGDNNPAMLEDGEYVLNRNAVKSIGKGYLDYINNQKYPRFQRGGQYDEGFEGQEVVGGRAQVIQPPVMDNSEAFNFSGGGGGEEGGGGMDMGMLMKLAPMLMGAPPMQRGGHIPGYQFGGGFSAPGGGARAQIIRPNTMDNSGAFDFGGGNLGGAPEASSYGGGTEMTSLNPQESEALPQNDWQEPTSFMAQKGGSVPQYQQGGTIRRPTGYRFGGYTGGFKKSDQESQTRLDETAKQVVAEGQIERMARDVTTRGQEESDLSREKEDYFNTFLGRGQKRVAKGLDWVFNPFGIYSPFASTLSGTDAESFQDLPEALWSKRNALPDMTAEDYPGMGIIDEPGYGRVAGAYTDAYGVSPPDYAKQKSTEELIRELKGGNSGGFFFNR